MIGITQRDYELSTNAGNNLKIISGLKETVTKRPDIQLTLFKEKLGEECKYYLTTDRYYYEVGNNREYVKLVGEIFDKFKTAKTIERRILALIFSDCEIR